MNTALKIKEIEYFNNLSMPTDSILDQLTKVVQRRYIMEYILYLILKKTPFSISILDVDNFKNFNDQYGHATGDVILRHVAEVLEEECSMDSIVGRYGGDEFIMVSIGTVSYENRWNELKSIYKSIRTPFEYNDYRYSITLSTGSGLFPDDSDNYDGLFTIADRSLYRAKSKGRNCYVIYNPEKHKNLTFSKEGFLHVKMQALDQSFTGNNDLSSEMIESFSKITNYINIDGACLYREGKSPLVFSKNPNILITQIDFDMLNELYDNDFIITNDRFIIKDDPKYYDLFHYLQDHEIKSSLAIRLVEDNKDLGVLFLFHGKGRVWQENELSLAYFLAKIISTRLNK